MRIKCGYLVSLSQAPLRSISVMSAPHNGDMKLSFPVKPRCFVPVTRAGMASHTFPCQISETCSPFIRAKHLTSNVTAVWPAICCLAVGHRLWALHQSVGQCAPYLTSFCSFNGTHRCLKGAKYDV